jgi:hypothetical protein
MLSLVEARGAGALLDRLGHFLDRFTDCSSRQVQRTAASQYGMSPTRD